MKKNKFGAKKVVIDNITFASKAEGIRYCDLKLLQIAGEITDLKCHPAYPLKINDVKVGRYTADFEYVDKATGEVIIEDVKGRITEASSLRIRVFNALYGKTVRIIK